MKRKIFLIASSCAVILAMSAVRAHAAEISIGGTALYQQWRPAWNNGKLVMYSPDWLKQVDNSFLRLPVFKQFAYGPALSIKLKEGWEISPAFSYTASTGYAKGFVFFPRPKYNTYSLAFKRYDVYADCGYYLLSYLKIFAALRVEFFRHTITYNEIDRPDPNPNAFHSVLYGETVQTTPELGINFTVPLTGPLSLLFNASGTFQAGDQKQRFSIKRSYTMTGLILTFMNIPRARYYAVGCNSSLSLRIDIPAIDVSLTAGGYYRLLSYIQKKSGRGLFVVDGYNDHMYGAIITAAYRFSAGERRKRNVWIPRPE